MMGIRYILHISRYTVWGLDVSLKIYWNWMRFYATRLDEDPMNKIGGYTH